MKSDDFSDLVYFVTVMAVESGCGQVRHLGHALSALVKDRSMYRSLHFAKPDVIRLSSPGDDVFIVAS
jgi:hypothetical protein